MSETPEHAVIAVFDDAAQAEQAAHDLIGWDKANDDIKLGAIGLLTLKGDGAWGQAEVETKNFSSRNTRKGAKVGMGLGVLAAVLSGGLTLVPSVIGGAVGGGAVGALSVMVGTVPGLVAAATASTAHAPAPATITATDARSTPDRALMPGRARDG